MPVEFINGDWRWTEAVSPTEHFGDALQWRWLHDTYPGWWTEGAGGFAIESMDAAMAGAGL